MCGGFCPRSILLEDKYRKNTAGQNVFTKFCLSDQVLSLFHSCCSSKNSYLGVLDTSNIYLFFSMQQKRFRYWLKSLCHAILHSFNCMFFYIKFIWLYLQFDLACLDWEWSQRSMWLCFEPALWFNYAGVIGDSWGAITVIHFVITLTHPGFTMSLCAAIVHDGEKNPPTLWNISNNTISAAE